MTLYAEKLLPHNTEAEEALIGSLLIDGACNRPASRRCSSPGTSTGSGTSCATTPRCPFPTETRPSTN